MLRKKKGLLLGILCICSLLVSYIPMYAYAQDNNDGGNEDNYSEDLLLDEYKSGDYTYQIGGGGCIITRYSGTASNLVIPDTLDGKEVRTIAWYSFAGNTNLRSVVIPDTVEIIDYWAFSDCSNLSKVTLSNNLTTMSKAFANCDSLESITIPKSLTLPSADADSAFSGCDNLRNVTIEGGGIKIPDGIFWGCSAIEHITIPEGIKTIGINSFLDCTSLKEINIPDSVEEIPSNAFCGCKKLEKVHFGEGLKDLGRAFLNCESLESITIPKSLTMPDSNVNASPFTGCVSLKTVVIEGGGTVIKDNFFTGLDALQNVTIPEGIKEIGDGAFWRCKSLKEINMPNSIEKIGYHAFAECNKLTTFKLGTNVKYVGEFAFEKCDKLTDFYNYSTDTVYETNDIYKDDPKTPFDGSLYVTIHGFAGSTSETFASKYNIPFVPLPDSPMYRLYNPNTTEHLYTDNAGERDWLVGSGWNYEGIAWIAPKDATKPVYRLFNPFTGEHHYTTDEGERGYLLGSGWNDEGIGWRTYDSGTPVYRLFNPNNPGAGSHHYTTDAGEKDWLASTGWNYEGIAWYGMK